jgi:NAD(P)H dehydrogenase (quinone)
VTQILVTYFSATGNTKALAKAVIEGVESVPDVHCVVKTVSQTRNDDWLAADGIIVGSPTYFGQMASKVKLMIDKTEKIYHQLEGKVGAAFTTSGGAGCGHEMTNMSIITALLVAGMVVQGTTRGPHFGPFSVGKPLKKDLEKAKAYGAQIARLTQKLFP